MPSIRFRRIALALFSLLLAATPLPSLTDAAETARYGGTLLAVIGADPPSLDPHQESTFATMQLVAPLYSTLLQFDPMSTQRSSAMWLPSGQSRAMASRAPASSTRAVDMTAIGKLTFAFDVSMAFVCSERRQAQCRSGRRLGSHAGRGTS
jgi:ABC-type transport system substrate-binding protein